MLSKFKMADGEEDLAKDPLSFFAAGESSSGSDTESEGEAVKKKENSLNSQDRASEEPPSKTKLPSPTTLFATIGRPAFLETKEECCVDWNSLSKRYEPHTYSAPPVTFSETLAERESEEYEEAVISSAPVKYGKEVSDIQKHLIIHEKRSVQSALNILNDRGNSSFCVLFVWLYKDLMQA